MKLIVGLGNPGEQYIGTRHNLGFSVIDHLSKKLSLGEWSDEKKFKAEVVKSDQIILAKPLTFMNNSGMAVALISKYYKIKPEDIVIIHDDLDLLLGRIKVRLGGGAAGHHGVESVIASLGTDQCIRVRIGIGNSAGFAGEHKRTSFSAEKFVLESFLTSERSKIKAAIKQSVGALESLITDGLEKVQNQFN